MIITKYILKELIPQFLSALIVICAIIVVSQLVRLSELLVTFGLSFENILLPFLYIILPFISLTIPIAFLFAVFLTFGRFSADGEYAGLLASGYSLKQAAKPVLIMAILLYGAAAFSSLNFEAWGRREFVQFIYRKTQTEIDNMIKFKMQPGVFLEDFLGYVLYAEQIADDRVHYKNVILAPGKRSKEDFLVSAPTGKIFGSVETGDLKLALDKGTVVSASATTDKSSVLNFEYAQIDLLRIFKEQILGADEAEDDFRSYTPTQLYAYIDQLEKDPKRDESTYRRARFLFHQRVSMPFSTVTFALFGMVLGIADPRRGKGKAYVMAILTILGGYILAMAFKWLSENTGTPAPFAAWSAHVILATFGGFLLYQKNRLPPSEGTLDWANMPFKRKTEEIELT